MPEPKMDKAAWKAIAAGLHSDPFAVLGPHRSGGQRVVRCFIPGADAVDLIDRDGNVLAPMKRRHADGGFEGELPSRKRRYLLRISASGDQTDIEDPYRFDSQLGELDQHLLGEGHHEHIYEILGAHPRQADGVDGVHFAVWAPNAKRVSVVTDFNGWDGRSHVMRFHPAIGIWDIFIPGASVGTLYKFELLDAAGKLLPLKSDPFARFCEAPPGNASIVHESDYEWRDGEWMEQRHEALALAKPQSIYEVHLGSWRRRQDEGGRPLSYMELANQLVDYVSDMGFTHVELLPITEYPFDGSWGYQPIGLYAPVSRHGNPDELKQLIDAFHAAGIGVIVDWVPAHFPRDPHGLGRFDGTALYEHEDPRRGEHADWGTLVYNYGRREVLNYLISNALFWVEEYHVDGLRVDAVASMLYLDYSRKDGEWLPNEHGGNENLEAVEFLHRLNEEVHQRGAVTIAEESTAWPGVSRPTYAGGLGFSYKWNMGWMNDTLEYMSEDSVHRKYHHERMTFSLIYAFNENFVLPLSHDEVVHGKRSLLGRMPGDDWQRFANLRAYYGYMFGHPGKKLLFMGNELAPMQEWDHDSELDWTLLDVPLNAGVQCLIRDLNRLYVATPALFERDFDGDGFEWIDCDDADNSAFSWIRRGENNQFVICVSNFTPVPRAAFRLGVPQGGRYRELLNTDSLDYGGSGLHNHDIESTAIASNGRPQSIVITLPPLATIVLVPEAHS